MRALQFFLIFVAWTISGDVAAQDRVEPSERVTNFVNIRAEASSDSATVGRLHKNESLEFVRNVPRWREVRIEPSTSGFVSKSWTRVVPTPPSGVENLVIHFLSIGSGACTVVECPGTNAPPMFIDCGSKGAGSMSGNASSLDDSTQTIRDILSAHSTAPNVVITHAHEDHYNWVSQVLNVVPQNIWLGGVWSGYSKFKTWVNLQENGGAQIHKDLDENWHNGKAHLGPMLSCGLAQTYVLTDNVGSNKSANSLVLMIEYGDFTAIFPGDAQGITEDMAMANFKGAVKATVLSGSHHGAKTSHSNDSDWAEATSPKVVVYSSGKNFGHPQCKAAERYDPYLATVPAHSVHCNDTNQYVNRTESVSTLAEYVTDANGTVVITTNGSSPLSLMCEGATGCDTQIPF